MRCSVDGCGERIRRIRVWGGRVLCRKHFRYFCNNFRLIRNGSKRPPRRKPRKLGVFRWLFG